VIPKIDSEIGILVYSTVFAGCGGQIRKNKEDFAVNEILSKKSLDNIKENDAYAVYKLKKRSIDTNHALERIFKKTGMRLKALGLKDASAVTEQYVCSNHKSKSIDELSTDKFSLHKVGFVKKPLSKKDMVGNHFEIKVTGSSPNIAEFDEYEKILNFFGYQRFGSKRPVTHLIGKAILQGDFAKAVDLLLSFTSPYDSKENTDLRKMMGDKTNYSEIIQKIPPQMDLERTAINEMILHGDPKKAIRALPVSMRRFFIQAYQSFLFNKTLSLAFQDGEDLFSSEDDDVCFDENGIIGKFNKDLNQKLAIPLVGYSYYKKTRFHNQISKILESEEIQPKNFFIKEMQEASSEGGFRNSSITCTDFSIADNTVKFTLSRGSFATIVLREIMKPEDPLIAGF
jgi:tRNA pseudouridine13 synthase